MSSSDQLSFYVILRCFILSGFRRLANLCGDIHNDASLILCLIALGLGVGLLGNLMGRDGYKRTPGDILVSVLLLIIHWVLRIFWNSFNFTFVKQKKKNTSKSIR